MTSNGRPSLAEALRTAMADASMSKRGLARAVALIEDPDLAGEKLQRRVDGVRRNIVRYLAPDGPKSMTRKTAEVYARALSTTADRFPDRVTAGPRPDWRSVLDEVTSLRKEVDALREELRQRE